VVVGEVQLLVQPPHSDYLTQLPAQEKLQALSWGKIAEDENYHSFLLHSREQESIEHYLQFPIRFLVAILGTGATFLFSSYFKKNPQTSWHRRLDCIA
jgi:hypothetical protein